MLTYPRFLTRAAIAASLAGTLAVAGCSGTGQADTPAAASSTPAIAPTSRAAPDVPENQALFAAARTALAAVDGTSLVGIESEDDGNHWEVKLAKTDNGQGFKVNVAADGRRILGEPRKSRQSEHSLRKWQKRLKAASVDYAKAGTAISAVRPGRITELELDDHHDRIVWEADVTTTDGKYKIRIDAGDGTVVGNKRD